MPSHDEMYKSQAKEYQKRLMSDVIVPYVKGRNFLDVSNTQSFSDRFYKVSGISDSLFGDWDPIISLIKFKNKTTPESKDRQNKYVSMSVSLDFSQISVFIDTGETCKMPRLEVPFGFKGPEKLGNRDLWRDEKRFVGYWLSYFDRLPLV